MRKFWKAGMVMLGLAGIFTFAGSNVSFAAEDKVMIDEAHFPDESFREYVKEKFDKDGDGSLSREECNAVTEIQIYSGYEFDNMTGLEYFTRLKELHLQSCMLKSLDVSKNTELKGLYCPGNDLTTLDLSNNKLLESLDVSNNLNGKMKKLDISGLTLLVGVSIDNTKIETLISGENPNLEQLSCNHSALTELKLSDFPKLKLVVISMVPISKLDISKCPELMLLALFKTDLEYLNIASNPKLLDVYTTVEPVEQDTGEGIVLNYSKWDEGDSFYSQGLMVPKELRIVTEKPGWREEAGKKSYMQEDGNPVKGPGLFNIEGKEYFFNKDGIVETGWVKIGDTYHYMDPDGAKATGWVKDGKNWFYLDEKTGAMKTGWVKDGKNWYFLDKKTGAMKTGWVKDGKWYYLNKKTGAMKTGWLKDGKTWYYLDKKTGAMAAGEYVNGYWLNRDGSWTYQAKASWRKNTNGWGYGDTTGWFAKSTTLTIDGKKYTFDAEGYLK